MTTDDPECKLDVDCPATGNECTQNLCVAGICQLKPRMAGTFCVGFENQCDGLGNCVDCVNSGGCGECCVCFNQMCIPA